MARESNNLINNQIANFSYGMTTSRENDSRYSQLIKNFDAHSHKDKLIPNRDSESGDSNASTSKKENFAISLRTGTTYSLYSLGVKTGAATAEVLFKNLTSTMSTDLSDNGWDTPSNNQSSAGSTQFSLFTYYRTTGLIYGARSNRYIWAFSPSGSSWNDTSKDLNDYSGVFSSSFTTITNGLVHSKDDILYIGVDNWLIANDSGTWTSGTEPLLELPPYLKITSLSEYGNYLAIGCAPKSGFGNSIVYLWDRDSSFNTISESIDWGEGELKILEEIEGELIGISYPGSQLSNFNQKVVFRSYSGGKASTIFKELVNDTVFTAKHNPSAKQKVNNSLYFLMKITINGVIQEGLWKISRVRPNLPFSVVLDTPPNNDTELTDGTLNGFIVVGDYKFISYIDSSTYGLSKTNNSSSYTATSVYETQIINDGSSAVTKQLKGLSVSHEKLASGTTITIKYKKDDETSFTTLGSNTNTNSLRYSVINIESTGAALPLYKDLTLRIEVTGGKTPITGLKYRSEVINDDAY